MNVYDLHRKALLLADQIGELNYSNEAGAIRDAIKYSSVGSEILVKLRFTLEKLKKQSGLNPDIASEADGLIDEINKIMCQ
jgi:hypothetical protein